MVITSKANSLVRRVQSLKEKKYRRLYGEFIVEGEKMVRESVSSSFEHVMTLVSESYVGETYGRETVVLSDEVFRFVSDEKTPQGILSVLKIPSVPFEKAEESCLILDGIADPGNMGTIIRTANAAGYRRIYCFDCTDPFSPKCVRASMSGIFFVEICFTERENVKGIGLPVVCADMGGENLFSFEAPEKFALAIGNEANGLSPIVRNAAERVVAIPMESTQESLNAAISAAIIMYHLKYHRS
ncbi:MAG: TrmH family RNA methyltransferase [Christensenellaceae bacterium]